MRQVRNNTFETNSSSTHSIAIPKSHAKEYPNYIVFSFDDFGWAFEEVNPATYLYTAIHCYYRDKDALEEKLNKLKSALDKYNIRYKCYSPSYDNWGIASGSIDHDYELGEFLDKVFESDETLLDFIFYGMVFTGNDNCNDGEYDFVHRYEKFIKDYDYTEDENGDWNSEEVIRENSYYESDYENYTWIEKGN